MTNNRHLEQDLCIAAYATLTALKPLNAMIVHIPNGGARGRTKLASQIIGRKIKDMGGRAGFLDYLVLLSDGRWGLIEAKLPEKVNHRHQVIQKRTELSPAQKDFVFDLTTLCDDPPLWAVFRTVEEFISILITWGVQFKHKHQAATLPAPRPRRRKPTIMLCDGGTEIT